MDRSSILRASTKKENVELFFFKNEFALVYSFDIDSAMYRLGSTYVVLLFLFTLLGLAKAGFTESTSRRPITIKFDPLVEGYGVAVATSLPVAGHAWLHQQSLALIVVVGCHLVRQRWARAHDAHPFCQDEKTLKTPICWIIGLTCRFLYCQWHCGQRIAPANRGYRFAHNKKRPTAIRRVGSSPKTASLP